MVGANVAYDQFLSQNQVSQTGEKDGRKGFMHELLHSSLFVLKDHVLFPNPLQSEFVSTIKRTLDTKANRVKDLKRQIAAQFHDACSSSGLQLNPPVS